MIDREHANLVRSISEAGLQAERWTSALAAIANFAGARGAAVIPLLTSARGLQYTESLEDLADTYISKNWISRDLRQRGVPDMLAGKITVDQDFISYDDMRKEPYYQDFLGPLGFRYFAGIGVKTPNDAWAVTLQRSIDEEPFGENDKRALATIASSLQDAATTSMTIGEAYHRGSLAQLDDAAIACVLINRLGRAGYLNAAARGLCGGLIDIRQGMIRLRGAASTAKLHDMVRQRLAHRPPVARMPAMKVVFGTGAYALEVLNLPDFDVSAFAPFACMVLIHPLDSAVEVNADVLRSVFDLTAREAALVQALARRSNLVEVAAHDGMSHETARSRLKSIMAKTGTRSQLELLGLVQKLASIKTS